MSVQAKYLLQKELTSEKSKKSVCSSYPFGMPMPNRQYSLSSGSKYRFGFNGKEKDNEVYGEGNAIDFGARIHDARIGRWLSVDPLQKKYPYASSYNFALNTPIQAKDPDGNVVLFINGQNTGDGGTAAHWGGFDQRAMDRIGDHSARYIDGALGGWKNTASTGLAGLTGHISLSNSNNISLKARINAGRNQGFNDAESIFNNLGSGESVKIVTHSMGAGYSRGYVEGMQKWAQENGREFNFEYKLDVNAFQAEDIPASSLVKRTDYKLGGKDGGIKLNITGTLRNVSETATFNSVPSVGPVPGANNITQPEDANKGHAISDMSDRGIPEAKGNVLKFPNYVEQGSNNKNAP